MQIIEQSDSSGSCVRACVCVNGTGDADDTSYGRILAIDDDGRSVERNWVIDDSHCLELVENKVCLFGFTFSMTSLDHFISCSTYC